MRHTWAMGKISRLLICLLSLSFLALSGCSEKKAFKIECVVVSDIQEPDRWQSVKAERISWDDGTVTYRKTNCGLWTGNYNSEEEPKP